MQDKLNFSKNLLLICIKGRLGSYRFNLLMPREYKKPNAFKGYLSIETFRGLHTFVTEIYVPKRI